MNYYPKIRKAFDKRFPDQKLLEMMEDFFSQVIEKKDTIPEALFVSFIRFSHLRQMEGFYTHEKLVHSLFSLLVGSCTAAVVEDVAPVNYMSISESDKAKLRQTGNMIIDRLVKVLIQRSIKRFGVPPKIDTVEIDRFCTSLTAAATLTVSIANGQTKH